MVKVVDVEISLDNFKRAFNRTPTQEEIGMMMRLKARNHEKQPFRGNMHASMNRRNEFQKAAQDSARERSLKDNVIITKQVWSINCLLGNGLNKDQIIDALLLTEQMYDRALARYNLPRKGLTKRFKHEKRSSII
tara:strand:+ start:363 stop:767 length:405 start_codon:yes stop_codon:yes gene_type:complete